MLGVKQSVIAGLGVSAVAGGGYGTYYLLQDKTIEDNLISKGIKLINNQDEYEVAFIENKEDGKLVNILTSVDAKSGAQKGGAALQKWCDKNLALDLSEENIKEVLPNVEKYCSKPSLTIEQRFTKLNKKQLLTTKPWKTKAQELKSAGGENLELKKDLGADNFNNDNDHTKVGQALENWCKKEIKTLLIKDKDETIWKKVDGRCLEPKVI